MRCSDSPSPTTVIEQGRPPIVLEQWQAEMMISRFHELTLWMGEQPLACDDGTYEYKMCCSVLAHVCLKHICTYLAHRFTSIIYNTVYITQIPETPPLEHLEDNNSILGNNPTPYSLC